MLRTVECEAVVLGCPAVEAGIADAGALQAAAGAEHLLSRLPLERCGAIVEPGPTDAHDCFGQADLPVPAVVLAAVGRSGAHYAEVAERLEADPLFCLALEHTPAGIDAALDVGMKVIGIATSHPADALGHADMVVPTLRSLHVVGTHPVLVLEVDALPDLGTFHPGTIKRR